MQKTFLIIPILMATMACSLFNPASSATPAVASTTAPASDESANQTQVINPSPITHQLEDARMLAQAIANREYQYPAISFTVMVAPVSLQIVQSNDGIESLTTFVGEMNMYPFIQWATIAETAQAWVETGSIPSRIEIK